MNFKNIFIYKKLKIITTYLDKTKVSIFMIPKIYNNLIGVRLILACANSFTIACIQMARIKLAAISHTCL